MQVYKSNKKTLEGLGFIVILTVQMACMQGKNKTTSKGAGPVTVLTVEVKKEAITKIGKAVQSKTWKITYLKRTRLSSRPPPGNALIVMYTPGSSCSTHSVSISLALLIETSERSASELVLMEPSTDDVSVLTPLMLESLGVEAKPLVSQY